VEDRDEKAGTEPEEIEAHGRRRTRLAADEAPEQDAERETEDDVEAHRHVRSKL
jgi:hypothetical protein